MITKKNIPLIIALAIPVLMIVLVAAFIYLPGIGQKPKYNFLYMSGNNVYNYYGEGNAGYYVSGGKLVYTPPTPPDTTASPGFPPIPKPDSAVPHFYIYDVAKNIATEITFDDAQKYQLDSSNQSPDGYNVQQGNGGGGDLFFGGGSYNYNDWFIKGHNRSSKLNLKLSGGASYYNFQFLGWIDTFSTGLAK